VGARWRFAAGENLGDGLWIALGLVLLILFLETAGVFS
jgi:hypothetical protein